MEIREGDRDQNKDGDKKKRLRLMKEPDIETKGE